MASVRQQINIAAKPKAVWAQLTTAEGIANWWADEARIDATAGGRVVIINEGDDGETVEERGTVLESRPTRRFEIKWDNGTAPIAGSRLRFQVARDGTETRVVLIHTGAFLDDDDVLARYDKEWRSALRALRSSLES